jgi:hypothetical protein
MQTKHWSTLREFFTVTHPTVSSFKDALNANQTHTDGLILQSDASSAYNTMTGAIARHRGYAPNSRKRSEWLQSKRRIGGAKNVVDVECDVRKFKMRHTLDFWVVVKCSNCDCGSDDNAMCRKLTFSLATHDQMNNTTNRGQSPPPTDVSLEKEQQQYSYSECTSRIHSTIYSSSLHTLAWKLDSSYDYVLRLDWHLLINNDALLGLWFKDVLNNLSSNNECDDESEQFKVIVEFELLIPPQSHHTTDCGKYERYLCPTIMRRDKPTANNTRTVCSTVQDAVDCNADFFYHTMVDHLNRVY